MRTVVKECTKEIAQYRVNRGQGVSEDYMILGKDSKRSIYLLHIHYPITALAISFHGFQIYQHSFKIRGENQQKCLTANILVIENSSTSFQSYNLF